MQACSSLPSRAHFISAAILCFCSQDKEVVCFTRRNSKNRFFWPTFLTATMPDSTLSFASVSPYHLHSCTQGTHSNSSLSVFWWDASWLSFKLPPWTVPVLRKCNKSFLFFATTPGPPSFLQASAASSSFFLWDAKCFHRGPWLSFEICFQNSSSVKRPSFRPLIAVVVVSWSFSLVLFKVPESLGVGGALVASLFGLSLGAGLSFKPASSVGSPVRSAGSDSFFFLCLSFSVAADGLFIFVISKAKALKLK